MLYTWSSQNTAGHTKKICTTGKTLPHRTVDAPLTLYWIVVRRRICRTVCRERELTAFVPSFSIILTLCAQIVGPLLYTTEEAPFYRRGLIAEFAICFLTI